ncbi:nitrous oxide-stimulated promoter family protein [Fontibacillus sp. BL9]|uniref:nitrous oxide-stimulated promoter family protein n=1 Tax=Fontibacillus sp. BL9 TaxID=3389971 RepID=UPI003979D667
MDRRTREPGRERRQEGPRIRREKATVGHMIEIFCKGKHPKEQKQEGLCPDCREMHRYAMNRLSYCRFGEEKSTCVDCPVHCYAPDPREMIKEVMRYAGPRMLWSHPVLTIRHMVDGRKSR